GVLRVARPLLHALRRVAALVAFGCNAGRQSVRVVGAGGPVVLWPQSCCVVCERLSAFQCLLGDAGCWGCVSRCRSRFRGFGLLLREIFFLPPGLGHSRPMLGGGGWRGDVLFSLFFSLLNSAWFTDAWFTDA